MSSTCTIDISQLTGADEATQALRLQALKGRKLLWLTCAYSTWGGVVATLADVLPLGVLPYMVFSDCSKGHALAAKCEEAGYLKETAAIMANISDEESAAENILNTTQEIGVKFDGVFSPYEHAQTLVGELCDRLNLTGNTKAAYVAARNKAESRDVCRAAGIPTPGAMRIKTEDDLKGVESELGFPIVLKPQSGAGSDGVYKCSNYEELAAAYAKADSSMKESIVLNWNPGCEEGILVESYLDGDEFDVDLLFWDGECVYGNANDNWATMEPTFLETGSNSPSTYSAEQQRELVDYSIACVKALGFTQGCFHVECKYTKGTLLREVDVVEVGQPMLIEVNPRLGGGRTNLLHKEVYGVNLQLEFVLSACGIPINPPRITEPTCAVADYCYCAPKTGYLVHTRFLDHVKDHPDVIYCLVTKQAGDKVKGYDTGIPEWVAFLAVKKDNLEDAVATLNTLLDTITIPVAVDANETEKIIAVERVAVVAPTQTA